MASTSFLQAISSAFPTLPGRQRLVIVVHFLAPSFSGENGEGQVRRGRVCVGQIQLANCVRHHKKGVTDAFVINTNIQHYEEFTMWTSYDARRDLLNLVGRNRELKLNETGVFALAQCKMTKEAYFEHLGVLV